MSIFLIILIDFMIKLCYNVLALKDARFIYDGGVAKWLNAADCKSAPSGFGGSNPSPSTNIGVWCQW